MEIVQAYGYNKLPQTSKLARSCPQFYLKYSAVLFPFIEKGSELAWVALEHLVASPDSLRRKHVHRHSSMLTDLDSQIDRQRFLFVAQILDQIEVMSPFSPSVDRWSDY